MSTQTAHLEQNFNIARRHVRIRRAPLCRAMALAVAMATTLTAHAIQAADIVEIVETWELQIGEPDPPVSAPQITMIMSPTGHLGGNYFVFTLNYKSEPSFQPGGMQVQQWFDDAIVSSASGPSGSTLNTTDETVRWKQKLTIKEQGSAFEIVGGESSTWGAFGGQGYLLTSSNDGLTNLNGYAPAISIDASGVLYAGNRVVSLELKRIDWVDSAGNSNFVEAPIDVDTDLDP